jgi:ketosteroid isomerase-like protein
MNLRALLTLLAVLVFPAVPAIAQPGPSHVPTVTRLVKVFADLEAQLVTNAHGKDASALDAMLDPSFEMRVGDSPGTPVPRADWMRMARVAPNVQPQIREIAVHDFGDVALVSFRQVTATGVGKPTSSHFIVDCWKRDGDGWKLAVRYRSEVRVAAGKAAKPVVDKRY